MQLPNEAVLSYNAYFSETEEQLAMLGKKNDVDLDFYWINGAFAAIHCTPVKIDPQDIILQLLDLPTEEETLSCRDDRAALQNTLIEYFNTLEKFIIKSEKYDYIYYAHQQSIEHASEWTQGFLAIANCYSKAWNRQILTANESGLKEEIVHFFNSITALAEMNNKPFSGIDHFLKTLIKPDAIQSTIAYCALLIPNLYKMAYEKKNYETIIQPEKIGRNDICTCGSIKKYKKCCGK